MTTYFSAGINIQKRRERIAMIKKILRGVDFNTFACRGFSGTVMAAPLSYVMKKHLVLVRKPGENKICHSMRTTEHGEDLPQSGKYIIIDDFTASGATCRAILEEMDKKHPTFQCVGAIFYKELAHYPPAILTERGIRLYSKNDLPANSGRK